MPTERRTSPGSLKRPGFIDINSRSDLSSPRDQNSELAPAKQTTKSGVNPLTWLWDKVKANEKLHLAWCVVGVVGCLMLYGVLQERIMVEPFGTGEGAERFKFSLFLVLCNRLSSCAIAVFCLVSEGRFAEIKPVAPWYNYAFVSISNVVATFCQYEALKYVSFPVQTLGKCAKMLPVMIWGIVIMRKRYTAKDFLLALSVTGGCTIFIMTGEVKSKSHAGGDNTFAIYGLALMLGYLGFDGFTSTFQDKLFKGYQMTTYNQILWTTIFSSLFSFVSMKLKGSEDIQAIQFVTRHPDALWSIITLSAAASIGALFISYTIKTFGALIFATIMTTRQFLSILLSCFLFLHPLSGGQWAGTVIVFGSLYYQGFSKKDSKHPKPNEEGKPAKTVAVDEESQALLKTPLVEGTEGVTAGSPDKLITPR